MMDELPIVTQADRDAAVPMMKHLYGNKDGSGADVFFERDILAGAHDDHYIVQAFKAHRIASNTEAADLISELVEALRAMVDEQCDYMRLNTLGDPEQQHNIKRARAALAKATETPERTQEN